MTARRSAALLLACAAAIMLAGCAVDASLSNAPTVYVDQRVSRAFSPEIYLEPQEPPMEPLSAMLVPLRMLPHYKNSVQLSTELTRAVWNVWLRERVFPGLSYDTSQVWHGPGAHLGKASATGADLLIGGEITRLMFGGTAGTTEIAFRMEAYDAATGTLVWSMAHAGSLDAGMTKDMVFFTKKNRLPSSPEYCIMATLAEDIATPLKEWNRGQPEEAPGAPSPLQ